MPIIGLFIVVNTIVGCCLAIRFGYGPPHWITALNLVVPAVEFQDWLNDSRDRLELKAPWTKKIFDRLNIPHPVIFIDVSAVELLEGEDEEENTEELDGVTEEGVEESDAPAEEQPESPQNSPADEKSAEQATEYPVMP